MQLGNLRAFYIYKIAEINKKAKGTEVPKRVDEFDKSVVLQSYGKCVGKPAIPYLKNL